MGYYKVKLDVFEGPLDLLLYLIKKNEVNIYDIPISKILAQYLEYLELMKMLDLNVAGEFIVVAATLMHIKSKMLLPPDEKPLEEELIEEDPRAELVKRLLEYKRFKEAAMLLREKEEYRREHFVRLQKEVTAEDGVYFEANLFDLISAFTKALKDVPKELFFEVIKDEFTVEKKVHDILHYLVSESKIFLFDLFSRAKNKIEIIAIFLSVLELIRLKEIIIVQKDIFSDILIMRNKDNIKANVSEPAQPQSQTQAADSKVRTPTE
ncbi:MAG: segregation/condensation protein A [Candidatus Omnitrophica bacterium]|nr:segregation/condensation protein A [Candidatus Omnitrophota bacterium]MDD5351872.1 segregation/condensation protein A [Candidatus Omnitrophota bacterium]MDD5550698.1 segregation/condensation protein A [Candidatus Omnitrophota bacterium]